MLKLSAGEPATISHLKQTYEWNQQQQVDDFSWYSAEFDETIKFEGIAETISVADLYKAASILSRAKQVWYCPEAWYPASMMDPCYTCVI